MERSSNLLDEALIHGVSSSSSSSSPGRVILVEDRVETSGAFVLHHLMKRALSVDTSGVVIFVALAQTFSHYDRILRKLGCNLVALRQNGRFFFLDMLKLDCPDGDRGDVGGGLVDLFQKIRKAVEFVGVPEDGRRGITIMIDDSSLLEVAAKGASNHVLDFLHYCRTLTSEAGCSLVILNHDDIYSSVMGPTLILHMEYLADIVVRAEPLATGLATDVHGQLTVLNKRSADELRSKIHNFHYRVKENSVEYFYPGTQT